MWNAEAIPLNDDFIQIFKPAEEYLHKVLIYYRSRASPVLQPLVAGVEDSPSWHEWYTYYIHKKNTTKLFKMFYL